MILQVERRSTWSPLPSDNRIFLRKNRLVSVRLEVMENPRIIFEMFPFLTGCLKAIAGPLQCLGRTSPLGKRTDAGAWAIFLRFTHIPLSQTFMAVSENRGTPISSYKPSILGYHYFWKHPSKMQKLTCFLLW